jgi:coenzyme F420-reducing hydrogenase beta subunit
MVICPREECTGCAACYNVCSHQAISMVEGLNGHLFPEIDDDKCVSCKLCVKTCPNNNAPDLRTPLASYVATAIESKEALTSTSAGIASVLSRYIIESGGVVYGACGWDCQHVHHIRIASLDDIDKLKGSKYVQSAIEESFKQLKKDLEECLRVLFIGTPCQVAGLYGYLRKKYDNLYTVDIICHGVPSQKVLTDALHDYLPKTDLSQVKVAFRKKEKGKSLYGLFVNHNDGRKLYRSVFPNNEYIVGFLYGLFYRESCYQCHYAHPERVSDITIGDYWDREKKIVLKNSGDGLSMVIVNTPKGDALVEKCSSLIDKTTGDYSDFVRRNGQLHHPIKKNAFYESFLIEYPKDGFKKAAQRSLKGEIKRLRKELFRHWLSSKYHSLFG